MFQYQIKSEEDGHARVVRESAGNDGKVGSVLAVGDRPGNFPGFRRPLRYCSAEGSSSSYGSCRPLIGSSKELTLLPDSLNFPGARKSQSPPAGVAEIVCPECGYRVHVVRAGPNRAQPEHDVGDFKRLCREAIRDLGRDWLQLP